MLHEALTRLSQKEELILLYLLQNQSGAYGLELVRESKGLLKKGTVYVTLSRMAKKGYVKSKLVDTQAGEKGPPRKKYQITAKGKSVLAQWHSLQQQMTGLSTVSLSI